MAFSNSPNVSRASCKLCACKTQGEAKVFGTRLGRDRCDGFVIKQAVADVEAAAKLKADLDRRLSKIKKGSL